MAFPYTDLNLYEKLNDNHKFKIDQIYDIAQPYYARTTWHGWIDHGESHIKNVLRYLNVLIPDKVMRKISPEEAFVLLTSAVLHDIGMCPSSGEETEQYTDEMFNEIRQNHGARGSNIINRLFGQLLQDDNILLTLICDITKNHHGEFNPERINYRNYPAQAMLVRLADNLDFGPQRAPFYLFEIMARINDQQRYWNEHLALKTPIIDNNLFRIQISGKVTHADFISQIRNNFEKSDHAAFQKIFFARGQYDHDCSYIIWDITSKKELPGEEVQRDPRPIKFNTESKLIAAQALYNSASYLNAITFFEKEVKREDLWKEYPYKHYFYHYLQTMNKLGMYSESIRYANKLDSRSFSREIQANIQISNGVSYYNLQDNNNALICFNNASIILRELPYARISLADTLVWLCIIHLSNYHNTCDENYKNQINILLDEAISYINEFKNANPDTPESHYMGRYHGFKVYYELFINKSTEWDTIIDSAESAYGGSKNDNRVDFGIMAGKYTEAVVYFCKYKHLSQEDEKKSYEPLNKCIEIMIDVLMCYKQIYGNYENNIKTIWDKISKTGWEMVGHTKRKLEEDRYKKLISLLEEIGKPHDELDNEINNLTPIN